MPTDLRNPRLAALVLGLTLTPVTGAQTTMAEPPPAPPATVIEAVAAPTAAPASAAADEAPRTVYRWVDDLGVTHFADAPPDDRPQDLRQVELAPLPERRTRPPTPVIRLGPGAAAPADDPVLRDAERRAEEAERRARAAEREASEARAAAQRAAEAAARAETHADERHYPTRYYPIHPRRPEPPEPAPSPPVGGRVAPPN